MIRIGKSYTEHVDGSVRLCADISAEYRGKELWQKRLWFGVSEAYGDSLTRGKADPFVAALIIYALFRGLDIKCEDPVSERLLYSLNHTYIPALRFNCREYHSLKIIAEGTGARQNCRNATGAGISLGVDSLYTFYTNSRTEYPVTHGCLINNGFYEGADSREQFSRHGELAFRFCRELGAELVMIDSNIHEALEQRYLDVFSQWNMACVLALQGLFGTYMCASGHRENEFAYNAHHSDFLDILTVECLSTETLRFFHSGGSVRRVDKIKELCSYPPAYRYMHPCYLKPAWEKNCGKCIKDIRDMVTIYALGAQDKFSDVYDFTGFKKRIPEALAFLMANENEILLRQPLELWKEQGLEIPAKAKVYAEIFRKSAKRIEESRK